MSNLRVIIDQSRKTALFSGSGTFMAKEEIKRLGSARWVGDQKAWEVRGLQVGADEIAKLFPGIIIENRGQESENIVDDSPSDEKHDDSSVLAGLPKSLTISETLTKIKFVLQEAFSRTIFIRGRISSAKFYGERVYLELSDLDQQDERISCIIWRDAEKISAPLVKAGFKLEIDLQVMFEVRVDLNRKDGRISLNVVGIVAEYTLAKLAAERELTNKRLKDEGIFGKNKELKLPFLPRRLGVLTSSGGTVINDFLEALAKAEFGFELFWLKTSVQGDSAVAEVVKGIKALSKRADLDAILLFRGGGSPAELAVFNKYEIAREICLSPIPFVSAIGHQEDQSSAQDVSFLALGVPKDIGHYFAEIVFDAKRRFKLSLQTIVNIANLKTGTVDERLAFFSQTLVKNIQLFVANKEGELNQLKNTLPYATGMLIESWMNRVKAIIQPIESLSEHYLNNRKERFVLLGQTLIREMVRVLEVKQLGIKQFELMLEHISPEAQLKRGFTLLRDRKTRKFLTSSKRLNKGDAVEIEFFDGNKEATID